MSLGRPGFGFTDRTPAEPAEIRLVAFVSGKAGVWFPVPEPQSLWVNRLRRKPGRRRVKVKVEGTAACTACGCVLHSDDTADVMRHLSSGRSRAAHSALRHQVAFCGFPPPKNVTSRAQLAQSAKLCAVHISLAYPMLHRVTVHRGDRSSISS